MCQTEDRATLKAEGLVALSICFLGEKQEATALGYMQITGKDKIFPHLLQIKDVCSKYTINSIMSIIQYQKDK